MKRLARRRYFEADWSGLTPREAIIGLGLILGGWGILPLISHLVVM